MNLTTTLYIVIIISIKKYGNWNTKRLGNLQEFDLQVTLGARSQSREQRILKGKKIMEKRWGERKDEENSSLFDK